MPYVGLVKSDLLFTVRTHIGPTALAGQLKWSMKIKRFINEGRFTVVGVYIGLRRPAYKGPETYSYSP